MKRGPYLVPNKSARCSVKPEGRVCCHRSLFTTWIRQYLRIKQIRIKQDEQRHTWTHHTCCFVLSLSLTQVPLLVYLLHHVTHLILRWKHLWREHVTHGSSGHRSLISYWTWVIMLPFFSPPDTDSNIIFLRFARACFKAMEWIGWCVYHQRICSSSAWLEDLLLLLRGMSLLSVGINQTGTVWLLLATKRNPGFPTFLI